VRTNIISRESTREFCPRLSASLWSLAAATLYAAIAIAADLTRQRAIPSRLLL